MIKIKTELSSGETVTTYYYHHSKVWITFAESKYPDKFPNLHAYSMKQAGKNHIKMSFDLREIVNPIWWNLSGDVTASKQ